MLRALALLIAATLALPGHAAEASRPTIVEWSVPWPDTRPRDPYVGPDGLIWFVGQRGHYIASLDPDSPPDNGTFRRIDLAPGTGPHNLIVAEDGTIYYAGNLAAHIGRVNPGTGAIHRIAMPDPAARDPHTLVFDGAGNIFFTVQGGNRVGRLALASEAVTLSEVETANARPYGIVVAPSGTVWATAFGSNRLLSIDPATVAVTEVVLPRESARPRRLAATSDGRIWYVDYADGMLGFVHPESGLIMEYAVPGGAASRPYAMTVDDTDRLWFVETGLSPNRLVGFDPVTVTFTDPVPIPSGGGTVRHMVYDADAHAIWFGADTNTVGRAALPR